MATGSPVTERARRDIEGLAAGDPAWRTWLALIDQVLEAADSRTWLGIEPELAPDRQEGAPLLAGASARVPASLADDWLGQLLECASLDGAARRAGRQEAVRIIEAAIYQESDYLAGRAEATGLAGNAFQSLADLAARPLLLGWAARVGSQVPAYWPHGYCPVCGTWPALAEARGLDRSRWLRCTRCGAGWRRPWLTCPYCSTTDHRQLASLVPETEAESRKVDVCNACHGYLKTVATLKPLSSEELLLLDAGTLDLDVAALQRDYQRPDSAGYQLDLQLVPAGRWETGR